MIAKLRSWWQKNRIAIGVGVIVFVAVIAIIIAGYWFDWSGFNGYTKVTIVHTISGPSAGTVTRTEEDQPGRKLWDWMQLLFVPGVLTLGAVWLTAWHNHDLQIAERQRQADRELAEDKYREEALEAYLDKMSDLLLKEGLRESGKDSEPRTIAGARTLTVFSKLDPRRKRIVLKFLFESGLIAEKKPIVNLSYADLKKADLYDLTLFNSNLEYTNLNDANLEKADLSGTNLARTKMQSALLREANLNQAILINADLRNATLEGANLTEANLSGANLSGANLFQATVTDPQLALTSSLTGTRLPNGSIHP